MKKQVRLPIDRLDTTTALLVKLARWESLRKQRVSRRKRKLGDPYYDTAQSQYRKRSFVNLVERPSIVSLYSTSKRVQQTRKRSVKFTTQVVLNSLTISVTSPIGKIRSS